MAELTGSQIVVEVLKREGVDILFGIPGGQALPLFDAFYDSGLQFVLARHEQGACHMADGYARASGRPGVCAVTSGPGATNIVTGLATAYMDSIPLVAITGQVRTDAIGSDAFQEADATGVTRPVTKHNFLVRDIGRLAQTLREAFHLAGTGRPGPILVDIPVDIQRGKTEFVWPEKVNIRSYKPSIKGNALQIKKAARLIDGSERPVLYVGGGAIHSGATAELQALAERVGIPVVWTLMANGAFPPSHALVLGPLGMHGKYASNMAVQKADLLIAAGARFDDRVTGKLSRFSPLSKKIHIDIDPASISKTVRADCPVVGDLKMVLQDLLELVSPAKHETWLAHVKELDRKHPFRYRDDHVLRPQYVLHELHRLTNGDAIVATGVGQHQMWAMQWYPSNHPRHFISSGGLGTMGYGFPAALGAKFARPEQTVVCIDGDGSFQMTCAELTTSAIAGRPVLVVILNNRFLGMVRQWQELFYGRRYSASYLGAGEALAPDGGLQHPARDRYLPDFVKLAEAHGALGLRVERKGDVTATLERALKEVSERTVVVDVLVDPNEKVFPMVPAGAALDEIIIDMA